MSRLNISINLHYLPLHLDDTLPATLSVQHKNANAGSRYMHGIGISISHHSVLFISLIAHIFLKIQQPESRLDFLVGLSLSLSGSGSLYTYKYKACMTLWICLLVADICMASEYHISRTLYL